MATTFSSSPESALKRANELINVGDKHEALDALHTIISSKKHKAWTKTHETIMFKYVELCVDLRNTRRAKDGLFQYRNITQHVNLTSLEDVIKLLIKLAKHKVELASTQAHALEQALHHVDNLEGDTPEDLMMSFVCGENGRDRSDRQLVTPSFRFLWETYITVLEVLRNHSGLEALYAMTVQHAFQFCKEFKRTTEFRRLCEIMRNHLAILNKYPNQRDMPDLAAPCTLQLYSDARFQQLKIATELKLWLEAFRSIEDIHGLMCMVKKTPKTSLMVVYYSSLLEIFWMSSNHLYHAYAWLKLFSLQKSFNKKLNQKDLQLIASSVVLAALSVPPYDRSYGASYSELEKERKQSLRVASLVEFDVESKPKNGEVISRASILLDLASKGVMTYLTQEVKELFLILEQECIPLELAPKVQALLAKISKLGGKLSSASSVPEVHLSQYVPSLEKLAALRLLHRISQVYQTINFDTLTRMVPFFDFSIIERISVDAVKNKFLAMKVDHRKGVIFFRNKSLESEGLRDHLSMFARSLSKARLMMYPPANRVSKLSETLPELVQAVEKEQKLLLARWSIIEKRKKEQENELLEMERGEVTKSHQLQKTYNEAEQKRLATAFAEMKKQRIRREIEECEFEEFQAMQQEANKLNKKKGKKPVVEGDNMDKKHLMEVALSEKLREKQEMEKKLQKLAKTMDYLERAKREETAPLIEANFQQRLVEDEALHELEEQKRIDVSRQLHARDLKEKNRLQAMLENTIIFKERVLSRRKAEYEKRVRERDLIIQSRKREREAKRKCEEERQKRLQEEVEAHKLEEMERLKNAEAERKAKLVEMADKQRQRDVELEKKSKQWKDEVLGKSAVKPSRTAQTIPPDQEVAAPAADATPSGGGGEKYVPLFRRKASAAAPPPETKKW